MPLRRDLAQTSVNDDERIRVNKINDNFRILTDALGTSSQGEFLQASKTVGSLMPEGEATTEFFDVIYPIGCVILTTTQDDARLSRGIWKIYDAGFYLCTETQDALVGATTEAAFVDFTAFVAAHVHDMSYDVTTAAQGSDTEVVSALGQGPHLASTRENIETTRPTAQEISSQHPACLSVIAAERIA